MGDSRWVGFFFTILSGPPNTKVNNIALSWLYLKQVIKGGSATLTV